MEQVKADFEIVAVLSVNAELLIVVQSIQHNKLHIWHLGVTVRQLAITNLQRSQESCAPSTSHAKLWPSLSKSLCLSKCNAIKGRCGWRILSHSGRPAYVSKHLSEVVPCLFGFQMQSRMSMAKVNLALRSSEDGRRL